MKPDKLINLNIAKDLAKRGIELSPIEGYYTLGEWVEYKSYIDGMGNSTSIKVKTEEGAILSKKDPYSGKTAPIYSLQTVQDYLREERNIDITICRSFAFDNSYYYLIYKDNDIDNAVQQESLPNRTYYTALKMAIQKALTYI